MSALDEVIGAIMAGVLNARRIADEESALVAEHYRNTALLDGMSVPRLRLPEVTLDLPIVVSDHQPERPPRFAGAATIARGVQQDLVALLKEREIAVPRGFSGRFQALLQKAMAEVERSGARSPGPYGDAAERAAREIVERTFPDGFDERTRVFIPSWVRRRAMKHAVSTPGKAPGLEVSVLTNEVKESSDPQTVTRLKLSLREEGLEWSLFDDADGQPVGRLTPE